MREGAAHPCLSVDAWVLGDHSPQFTSIGLVSGCSYEPRLYLQGLRRGLHGSMGLLVHGHHTRKCRCGCRSSWGQGSTTPGHSAMQPHWGTSYLLGHSSRGAGTTQPFLSPFISTDVPLATAHMALPGWVMAGCAIESHGKEGRGRGNVE